MLEHGGNLLMAAQQYAIPLENWLDLSTGINPQGWPVPTLPQAVWQRLPEQDDGLIAAAAAYYGSPHLLPTAGSQPVIQCLPRLRTTSRVGVLTPSYAEHAYAWARKGHQLIELQQDSIEATLPSLDVLIICNPNNPTGIHFSSAQLLAWSAALAQRDGWLIVDEAFIDATPELSIAAHAGQPGLVILRSMGKFFGLAGARAGAVLAWPTLLQQIEEELGPWAINGPARLIAAQAWQDTAWQDATRQRLSADSSRLATLLSRHALYPSGATPLFQWVSHPEAKTHHQALARHGIWTRYFDNPCSIRFGLPGPAPKWRRLETALRHILHDARIV